VEATDWVETGHRKRQVGSTEEKERVAGTNGQKVNTRGSKGSKGRANGAWSSQALTPADYRLMSNSRPSQ
jgi:hypothetical protein